MEYDTAVNAVKKHLAKYDLDIRKSKFSRFMDQKVTPDVLCFIADCIINLPNNQNFTTKDIWKSGYFEKNVRAIFGKPSPTNEKAQSEYDKFIIQPLRMLYYAKILDSKKEGLKYNYSVKEAELLEFISIKERNAYIFLSYYINKLLSDSGMLNYFDDFKNKCKSGKVTREDFDFLKKKFISFMMGHTPINQDVEIRRIFPKILNIYSHEHSINGTIKGNMSKYAFNFSDLMYNHENWRDVGKAKELTRTEAQEIKETTPQQENYHNYIIEKAKDKIKRKYASSEVHDAFANGPAVHVHHIFPVSTHPKLAEYLENLIKLTASQHLQKAHPNGNTQVINRDYQCVCLLAKSKSIEDSLSKGELFYTMHNFVFVVNNGLNVNLSISINLIQMRHEINKAYNAV